MQPTKTPESNFVYKGPRPGIGDLDCQRVKPHHIRTAWKLTDAERAWIAAGADVELELLYEPIPPVSLSVTEPFCGPCGAKMALELHDEQQEWIFRCPHCRAWAT